MPANEKSAWTMVVVTIGVYGIYLAIILGRAENLPFVDVPYVATMLWSMGAFIPAAILGHIVLSIATYKSPEDFKKDERDRMIHRLSEYSAHSMVSIGGAAALFMAMAEVNHFWIANAMFLAFSLSSLYSAARKIVAYRRGFAQW
jgi:hypothetical protein